MKVETDIRIGNQTAFSAETLMQPFEYAVSNGFDAFEWFPDKKESGEGWMATELSKDLRTHIRSIAYQNDIRLSVHAPWQANPLNRETHSFLFSAVDLAQDIDASLLNIHLYTDGGVAAYVEAILPLLERLAEVAVSLSIENTPNTGPADINELFRELTRRGLLNQIQIGMCLDLGHANLCEATRNDYLKFIDLLEPQVPIIHAHVHENYGDIDCHLPLFTGPSAGDESGIVGFVTRMKQHGFSGSFILEQWPQPPSLLNEARTRLCTIIESLTEEERGRAISEPQSRKPDVRSLPSIEGDDFAAEIARADLQNKSWRRKLAWVADLLANRASELGLGELAYLAVYFRFMGNGQVPFAEDGGHYRPSHHAKTAQTIHEQLSAMTTPENSFIIRKIYPWLPSYATSFTRAEPLTRIRDIAHRNDIPQEFKREIKTTLQNKLHRCAGPEDLVTSRDLLARITSPDADYSPAFVDEFKWFHEELKEFFNARSLDEQLRGMVDREKGPQRAVIMKFLRGMEKTETPAAQLETLKNLTQLRVAFNQRLHESEGAEAQEIQLADIKLEDYCFVLLSQLINGLEPLAQGSQWKQALSALILTTQNLRLSGLQAEECRVIESELAMWCEDIDPKDRDQLIHLKAVLDRAGRLAETYCAKIMMLFPNRAVRLGRLLGVADHAIRVFAEADIRSHPVFQLSKLVAMLQKRIRTLASLSPWDVIIPGRVLGRLIAMARLEDTEKLGDETIVALLKKVEGDEEIPRAVGAIIVAENTPHLSHLAVRARQQGVVFVVCEEQKNWARLEDLTQKKLKLEVSAEAVDFSVSAEVPSGKSGVFQEGRSRAVDLPQVELFSGLQWLPLDQVTPQTGGGKAYGAKRLEELSHSEKTPFKTPPGIVIPFGVMEKSLNSEPKLEKEYQSLVESLNHHSREDFDSNLERLRAIIEQLRVPEAVVSGVKERFSERDCLMVRSSSNSEDLQGLAGAGLYESIGNVGVTDMAQAVRKVWASLWTVRAAISRKNLGIPHEKAHMAVLIQPLVVPDDLSFIMHTVNPTSHNRNEVYVELAVGLGETLASGAMAGVPFRITCNKLTGEVCILSFASFSQAVWPDDGGGLISRLVNYTTVEFASSKQFRNRLSARLGAIGRVVEESFDQPQDIEGLVSGDVIYLVQSRPQQGEG